MLLRTHDTIVAIASAAGGALRGIIRVSGPHALDVATRWFQSGDGTELGMLTHPTAVAGVATINERGDRLPGDLYIWPGVRSYTRQPTVEFHTLGSPPLLDRLVQTICSHGARPAEPGEFTLRAFLAGRLDLTQAEAVLGVIDAGSRTELDVALRQLGGGLAKPLSRLRSELLDALAHLEAGLDFAEEDIEFIAQAELRRQLMQAREEVARLAERMSARSTPSTEYRVVLYGRPNVGKSSLLNALAQSQQAIVSDVAGTTRDYITVKLDCGGFPCLLVDTAGRAGDVPSSATTIENAAENAARSQAEEAHLQLLCLDSTRSPDAWEQEELNSRDDRRLVLHTKCDVATNPAVSGIATSSLTGLGLNELRQAIAERLSSMSSLQADVVSGTAVRCLDSLERTKTALATAIRAVAANEGEELVAGELRIALEELGRTAGAVYTDDILERIFSRFCIGK